MRLDDGVGGLVCVRAALGFVFHPTSRCRGFAWLDGYGSGSDCLLR